MRVLISDSISMEAVNLLKKNFEVHVEEVSPEKLIKVIKDFDALIVRSRTKVTKEVIQAGKSLKVIGRAGIGVDNIDIEEANRRNIPVVYAPQGSTISVAEITVGQMLSLARNLIRADISTKKGLWEKKKLMGMEISGKTLGLIGLGRIGLEVTKRCKAFNMKIIAFDPYIKKSIAMENDIELCENVNEVYERSDIISIHAILTEETRNMVNLEAFNKMKKTAFIINYSRGGIINENDLVKALKSKMISGAALDVFEKEPLEPNSPLLDDSLNINLSPHIGASTVEAQIKAGTITAQGIIDVLNGKVPEFCVNINKIKL
jgi:D-3-phosphoglycerate dehydrogenase